LDELMDKWFRARGLEKNSIPLGRLAYDLCTEYLVSGKRYELDPDVLNFIAEDWFFNTPHSGAQGTQAYKTHLKLDAVIYGNWVKEKLINDPKPMRTLMESYGVDLSTVKEWRRVYKKDAPPTPSLERIENAPGNMVNMTIVTMKRSGEKWRKSYLGDDN